MHCLVCAVALCHCHFDQIISKFWSLFTVICPPPDYLFLLPLASSDKNQGRITHCLTSNAEMWYSVPPNHQHEDAWFSEITWLFPKRTTSHDPVPAPTSAGCNFEKRLEVGLPTGMTHRRLMVPWLCLYILGGNAERQMIWHYLSPLKVPFHSAIFNLFFLD